MSERSPDPPQRPVPRQRYARPHVRTEGLEEAPLLLCTTGRPYLCEGSGCCDASPDCDLFCGGG